MYKRQRTDIIGELELKIEPLAQQSEKAKTYLGYKEELKKLDINYFKLRVDKIDEELKKIEYNIEILKNDLNDKNKIQDSQKQKISNIKLQIEEISEKLQSFNERISGIRTEIEKKQGEIKLTKEQIQNLELNINRLENEIDQKNVSINDKTQEINIHLSLIHISIQSADGIKLGDTILMGSGESTSCLLYTSCKNGKSNSNIRSFIWRL